jgi:hypothetical protein
VATPVAALTATVSVAAAGMLHGGLSCKFLQQVLVQVKPQTVQVTRTQTDMVPVVVNVFELAVPQVVPPSKE